MKNIIKYLFVAGIVFLITYLLFVRTAKQDKTQLEQLLETTRNEFVTRTTRDDKEITEQRQTIATLENAVAAGLVERDEVKKLNYELLQSVIRLEATVERQNLELSYTKPPEIIYVRDSIPGYFMRIPADFSYLDRWTSIDGTVEKQGILLRNMKIRTGEASIFTGWRRQGFFKPAIPVVSITFNEPNPYLQIISMENIQITAKPPFYRRAWWHRLEGAAMFFGVQYAIQKL